MKRLSAFILALTLLTLVGCNKANNTSSEIDIASSEIVSLTDETSLTENTTNEIIEEENSSDEKSFETSSKQSSGNSYTYSPNSTSSKTESASTSIETSTIESSVSNTETKTESETSSTESSKTESTQKVYETFTSPIGIYETKNLPSVSTYYDDRCPAWIGVYSIGKNANIENQIKTEFQNSFGYAANEKVEIEFVGEFIVDGYATPQDIYQYTITDLTYPLLLDDFYVIKKQVCDDGSAWVGFAVPGNVSTMDTSSRVTQLLNEMNQLFCDWTGYSLEYVQSNNLIQFIYNGTSSAGYMRTTDGRVLEVVYRYTRGINMPVSN